MTEYLRWVGEQFYLLIFWPSRFAELAEENVGGKASFKSAAVCLRYQLKLLPFTIFLSMLGALLLASVFNLAGFEVNWQKFWSELPRRVAFGVGSTTALGVTLGVMGSVAIGVAIGVAFGIALGVGIGVMGDVLVDVADGVAFGVTFGVTIGVGVGVAISVLIGVVGGLKKGLKTGVKAGVATGVMCAVLSGVSLGVRAGVKAGVMSGVAFGVAFGVAYLVCYWFILFRLPWLFVDHGLAWFARLRLERGSSARDLWRWHPLRWNEVIWLPLHDAGAFLAALVREDRDYGFDQLIFVATHRHLQAPAVSDALIEIVIDDLKCRTLADFSCVSERLAWSRDTELSLPDILKNFLPAFDRIAQHAAQAHTVTSAFRRCEVLETALDELSKLSLRSATQLRRFGTGRPPEGFKEIDLWTIIDDWKDLLRAERDKAAALVTAVPLPNPFAFGPPVRETEDQRFTGRRDVLQDIERALLGSETVPTLLLLGARRMGKSSLLNQLPRLLGPDCAPAVVDAQGANSNSLPGLALACAREVSEALRRRRVEPPEVDRAAFERDPLRALDDWVRAVETRLPGKLRVLLCVDEYERLEAAVQAGWGGPFLDQMRHILQHHPRFGLMFTGAKPLRALGPAWTDRFISVRPLRVSFLREEDMRLLLTKPIPEFDLDYRPGALERLMDLTRGQPFLTQCVAYELVDRLNAANRKYAEPADVDAAAAKALETGDAYFANLWSDAGPDGQAALRALLQTGSPPASGPVRTLLRELEILTDEGQFAVPLVRRWVEAEIAKGN